MNRLSILDLDYCVKTIYGEARGESRKGQIAVLHVVRNRAEDKRRRWPNTLGNVCIQKWQFSCWNENDPNRKKLEKLTPLNPDYRAILETVLEGLRQDDVTGGANHYYADYIEAPKWAAKMEQTTKIGRHIFLKG